MAKNSRGRAPRDKKPSLKVPEVALHSKAASDASATATVPTRRSVPGPDFKKVIKKLGKKR